MIDLQFVTGKRATAEKREVQNLNAHQKGEVIFVAADEGRSYDMGRIKATFKADGEETANQFSISEWWMEANTKGVGAHSHDRENEIFYVLDGTMSFLIGDTRRDANKGSFIFVPAGVEHDFENRSQERAGVLNIFSPGAFEANMPKIVEWFAEHPPEDAVR
ncbi:cupin domain-containing protein [Mesorhizobium sp. NBSH29]|uniref:cupin domain-containing protein n=1 Tax=Mesorhizobium sp. NBSH29 TaxID=2654249 RepID=UPI001AEE93A1|nr:cupin domain-containing protein [Mesorhizobium sp. NBSH29]